MSQPISVQDMPTFSCFMRKMFMLGEKREEASFVTLVDEVYHHLYHDIFFLGTAFGNH